MFLRCFCPWWPAATVGLLLLSGRNSASLLWIWTTACAYKRGHIPTPGRLHTHSATVLPWPLSSPAPPLRVLLCIHHSASVRCIKNTQEQEGNVCLCAYKTQSIKNADSYFTLFLNIVVKGCMLDLLVFYQLESLITVITGFIWN